MKAKTDEFEAWWRSRRRRRRRRTRGEEEEQEDDDDKNMMKIRLMATMVPMPLSKVRMKTRP